MATCNLCNPPNSSCSGKCWASGLENLQGDGKLIYAGVEGLIASMRLAGIRDGLEDHEMLAMLKERQPAIAQSLVAQVIQHQDAKVHVEDTAKFSVVRYTVLEALEN